MHRLLTLLTLCVCALAFPLREGVCTGINITNISVGTLSGGSTSITFDVTWTNSWRFTAGGAPAPNNWDAGWVFVKFRKNGGDWTHASLNDTGHSVGSGTAATYTVGYPDTSSAFNIATNPGVGVFLYRSGDGTGTFTLTGASVSWNYSQDGVTGGDTIDVRVFGIEMAHVPQGVFFAGDAVDGESSSFRQGATDEDPWYIPSEGAITTWDSIGTGPFAAETAAEYFYMHGGDHSDGNAAIFTIPAPFPKGYQAFYIMKGEISQRQWVAFFNTLTATQKSTRDITSTKGDSLAYRNNVSWTSGDATLPDQGGGATYAWGAMSYLSWADLTAYLDWSGLRPMSELEFERAARGPYRALIGEYSWGSNTRTQATSITDSGLSTERAQSGANVSYGEHASVQGPLRVGSFGYGVATRIAAGAGYYGIFDLSGNVYERCVTVGNSTGRAFEGRYHGNGALDSSGNPNVTSWPGTAATGSGFRGGSWQTYERETKIANRERAAETSTFRNFDHGGRGVRTAP